MLAFERQQIEIKDIEWLNKLKERASEREE
jgi:hypothetical protein